MTTTGKNLQAFFLARAPSIKMLLPEGTTHETLSRTRAHFLTRCAQFLEETASSELAAAPDKDRSAALSEALCLALALKRGGETAKALALATEPAPSPDLRPFHDLAVLMEKTALLFGKEEARFAEMFEGLSPKRKPAQRQGKIRTLYPDRQLLDTKTLAMINACEAPLKYKRKMDGLFDELPDPASELPALTVKMTQILYRDLGAAFNDLHQGLAALLPPQAIKQARVLRLPQPAPSS